MQILITGAFGNIGQKVVHNLLDKSYQAVCFDLDNPTNQEAAKSFGDRIETVWGDITNEQQVLDEIAKVDAVIHMAALLPAVVDRNPELGEKVNVGGTKNVIKAVQASPKQPQLIFCSSISVHGNKAPSAPFPVRVDDPFNPGDTYAAHKITCEKLIREAGISATVVRIGACVDADSEIAGDAKEMIRFLLKVNPDCRIEYIHPKDVAMALANSVNNSTAIGKTYFLGGGESCQTTWGGFTGIMFGALGVYNLPRDTYGSDPYYTEYLDTAEAQQDLQYQAHTLAHYIEEMNTKYRWYRIILWPFRPLMKRWLRGLSPN